jgi:hypothetical protein
MTDTVQTEAATPQIETGTQKGRRYESLGRAARDLDMRPKSLEMLLAAHGYSVLRLGPRTKKVDVEDIAALVRAAKQPATEGA